jgi:hypothetical protein
VDKNKLNFRVQYHTQSLSNPSIKKNILMFTNPNWKYTEEPFLSHINGKKVLKNIKKTESGPRKDEA